VKLEIDTEELAKTIADILLERLNHLNKSITDGLLTVDELSDRLQVPKSWIYERTRNKCDGIPHIKVGKYVRFNLTEVLDWLNKRKE